MLREFDDATNELSHKYRRRFVDINQASRILGHHVPDTIRPDEYGKYDVKDLHAHMEGRLKSYALSGMSDDEIKILRRAKGARAAVIVVTHGKLAKITDASNR